MRTRELEKIRQQLLEQRAELLKLFQHEVEESRQAEAEVEDEIDQATTSYQRDLNLTLSSVDYERLSAVENAIAQLDAGTYGTCETCGETIVAERLKAVPWTAFCVRCQEEAEANAPVLER